MKYTFLVKDIDGYESVIDIKAPNRLQAELLVQQEVSGWVETTPYYGSRPADYVLGGK